MTTRRERRYDLAPLLRHVGNGTVLSFAQVADVQPKQAQRWRTSGIPEYVADRLACRFGFHPIELWPSWCDDMLDDTARRFTALAAETHWSVADDPTTRGTPFRRFRADTAFRRLREATGAA